MTEPPRQARPSLDDYLDGHVTPTERARFEQEIASDPDLAAQVRLQRSIDDSLRAVFVPSSTEAATRAGRAGRIGRWGLSAAAAVLLAALAGVYFAFDYATALPDRLGGIYHAEVSAGFQPREVCTTDAEFAAWLSKNYGEPLNPPPASDSLRLVGWSYAVALTSYSGVLLAEAGGTPVVVVVDRAANESRRLPQPEDPALRMFRRKVGSLVFYEVTPLDQPAVLPGLSRAGGN